MTTNVFDTDEEKLDIEQCSDRLRRRSAIRRRMAEAEVAREKADALSRKIRDLELQNEIATNDHQAATAELQQQIAELDSRQASAIVAGETLPTVADQRAELFDQVQEKNEILKATLKKNKQRIASLIKEVQPIRKEAAQFAVLETELINSATDELQDVSWCVARQIENTAAFQKACQRRVSELSQSLAADRQRRGLSRGVGGWDTPDTIAAMNQPTVDVPLFEKRLRRWRVAVDRAQQQLSELTEESRQIRKRMLTGDGD